VIPISVISNAGAAALANEGVAFLGSALIKGAALLAGSALAAFALHRASAAARHLVWTAGVIAVLVLPPAALVLPAWRISLPLPALFSTQAAASRKLVIVPEAAADTRAIENPISSSSAAPQSSGVAPETTPPIAFNLQTPPEPFDWGRFVLVIWAAGVVVSLSALALSWLRVRALHVRAQPMRAGPFVDAVRAAARRLGVRRVPAVCVGDERMMPMVWGLFRPILLLPASAALWPKARLEAVILHELAHISRRDALTQFLAEIARAVYWYNPLVWVAARRLYIEREHACDDIVLNSGTRASEYAGELLDLVRSLRPTRATAMAAIAMARPSQLKVRLHAVLDDARSRRALTGRFIVMTAAAALALLLPIAALHPKSADAATLRIPMLDLGEGPASPAKPARPAHPSPPARPGVLTAAELAQSNAPAVSSSAQESCWGGTNKRTSVNHTQRDEDRNETITWSSDRCSGSARIEGTVRLNGDLTGIESISSGGLFRITEDNGDHDRRLTVRPVNGRLEYQYRVDGRDVEFDASGRTWLSQALLSLYRNTGFAATERVDHLLRTQGVQGVLNEVTQLRGDYSQRVYLTRLLERADLSPANVKQAMEIAARELESDYELAQTLIAFANKHDLTDETRTIFINATTTISSDYERRRVLSTALAKGGLRSQDVSAMLSSASTISSDYEKSQLLLGLADKYKLEPTMRASYLKAAGSISSDYEKRRVFTGLVKQGALSPTELATLLDDAAGIRSDYEKAQVLKELSQYDLSDPALQRAYLTAARGMSSSYEHRQVLTSLLAKEKLTPGNLNLVLQSAADIDSDYELSQVLLTVLKNHSLNPQQKELFMKALNSISSEYEYGKVASALLRNGM
jgi:beta-lactamase regulating signal transducer with metallopeptidase domain